MYNGIGLTTPRGSGTNGYVVRNLSHLRSHDTAADRAAMDSGPMKQREPDKEILEHERKRKVEVACFELRLKLEDDGKTEEEIEAEVDVLRTKLLAQSAAADVRQQFKPSDTHAILAAKKTEMERMARALGTSANYVEGQAFDPAHAEEMKKERIARREQKEMEEEMRRRAREENERAWKEKERLRRRAEDAARGGARGKPAPKDAMPPPRFGPRDRRERSRSPLRRESGGYRGPPRRDRSPPSRARHTSRSRSRSLSPPPKPRRRSPSSSRASPRRRGASPSNRGRTRTRSPPSERSRSWSPRNRNRRDTSMSRSRSSRSRSLSDRSFSSSSSRSRSRSRSVRRRRSYSRSFSSRSRSAYRSRSRSWSRSRSRSYSPPRYGGGRGRGRGRGGRAYSPPRRGYGGRGRGGPLVRRDSRSPPRRFDSRDAPRRRPLSVSRSRSPIHKRRRTRSRSVSPLRGGKAVNDAKMRSPSPAAARDRSPARSEGSVAMDESD